MIRTFALSVHFRSRLAMKKSSFADDIGMFLPSFILIRRDLAELKSASILMSSILTSSILTSSILMSIFDLFRIARCRPVEANVKSVTANGTVMHLVPAEFFVASASASSKVSDLNAFDKALIKMNIGEQNLVAVSSVIPVGAKEVKSAEIPMGAVTHCVLSEMRGTENETIAAGIAYAFRKDGRGGYVAEGRSHGTAAALRDTLEQKMNEIAGSRNVQLNEIRYVIESMTIPKDHFGACVAALVFTRYG